MTIEEAARMLNERGWRRDRFDWKYVKLKYEENGCSIRRNLYYMPDFRSPSKWQATCDYVNETGHVLKHFSNWSETVEEALEWVEQTRRRIADES